MNDIIFGTEKVRVYEDLKYLCEYTGKDVNFADELWSALLESDGLYSEFVYYLKNHTVEGSFSFEGYTILDMFVYRMNNSNLRNDTGKNTAECNKDEMLIESFMAMAKLIKDPEGYKKKLSEGRGMDKM